MDVFTLWSKYIFFFSLLFVSFYIGRKFAISTVKIIPNNLITLNTIEGKNILL